MFKPLIADSSYPDTDKICKDAHALQIISQAYSTSCGELNVLMQYIFHAMQFYSIGDYETYETLKGIAVAEMMHFEMLGKTISALGAAPVFTANPPFMYNFYSTKFVGYSCSVTTMIEDDLIGERRAINMYERMLCKLRNGAVRELICRIIEDENLHVLALENILKQLNC